MVNSIKEKLNSGEEIKSQIPGNRPYKKAGGSGMVPKTSDKCVKCGLCAKKCPVAAIDKYNPKNIDSEKCISCMRCTVICPKSAKHVGSVMLAMVETALKKSCSVRKECELYL